MIPQPEKATKPIKRRLSPENSVIMDKDKDKDEDDWIHVSNKSHEKDAQTAYY